MNDYQVFPIIPHLLDLLYATRADDTRFILAGGLGLWLKREEVIRRVRGGAQTLREALPEARATKDMDMFVDLDIFATREREARLRDVLEHELGYKPVKNFFQFSKTLPQASSEQGLEIWIKLDLMGRAPDVNDPAIGRSRGFEYRLGTKLKRPGSDAIHLYRTREAFAVDASPQELPIKGHRSSGEPYETTVQVPHPFASLMMKIGAALDHARTPIEQRKRRGGKHAYDVYLILAMMLEHEWEEVREFTRRFAEEAEYQRLKGVLDELFESEAAQGCLDVMVTHRESGGDVRDLDLRWMHGQLKELTT